MVALFVSARRFEDPLVNRGDPGGFAVAIFVDQNGKAGQQAVNEALIAATRRDGDSDEEIARYDGPRSDDSCILRSDRIPTLVWSETVADLKATVGEMNP